MEIQKKIGRFISLRMGFAMSFIMSFVGSLRGTLVGTINQFNNIPVDQRPPFPALFFPQWIPSFLLSALISCVIAITLGFILPMKKINDGVANITKAKGFALHFFQGLVSGLIYAPIIGLAMTFLSTALFALPNQQKGMDNQITAIEAEISATQEAVGEIAALGDAATPEQAGQLEGLNEKLGQLNGQLGGIKEARAKLTLVPLALKNFVQGMLLEFIVAVLVGMFIEPKIQQAAFKKYIPNYGQAVAGDDDI